MEEHRVSVHPTTVTRWVHEYGNPVYQMWKKKTNQQTVLGI
ncbi:hypothetical protein [Bacillus tropicus]|nr:hypothetical protein [Bacillus tropicus]